MKSNFAGLIALPIFVIVALSSTAVGGRTGFGGGEASMSDRTITQSGRAGSFGRTTNHVAPNNSHEYSHGYRGHGGGNFNGRPYRFYNDYGYYPYAVPFGSYEDEDYDYVPYSGYYTVMDGERVDPFTLNPYHPY